MADSTLLTVLLVRQLLDFNPETGALTWKRREVHQVNSPRESTRHRICRNWNARYEGKPAFVTISKRGYYAGCISADKVYRLYAHRVGWAIHYGKWPQLELDHINGNRLDNKISNLREVTRAQNGQNTSMDYRNKTGYPGIWWDKTKQNYQAYITCNQRRHYLGRFKRLDDAVFARQKAMQDFGFHPNHGRVKTTQ